MTEGEILWKGETEVARPNVREVPVWPKVPKFSKIALEEATTVLLKKWPTFKIAEMLQVFFLLESFLLATPSQDVFLLLPLIPLGREVGGILLVMLLYDLRDDPSISIKVYLWDSFDGRDGDSCQAEW